MALKVAGDNSEMATAMLKALMPSTEFGNQPGTIYEKALDTIGKFASGKSR